MAATTAPPRFSPALAALLAEDAALEAKASPPPPSGGGPPLSADVAAAAAADVPSLSSHPTLAPLLAGAAPPDAAANAAAAALADAEASAVAAFVQDAAALRRVANDGDAATTALSALATSLDTFQAELGSISTDVRGLQSRSASLATRLANRRAAAAALGAALDVLAFPSTLAAILAGADPGSDAFTTAVAELGTRLATLATSPVIRGAAAAAADVEPHARRLRALASTRARDWLLTAIAGLKAPRTNIQVRQRALLAPRAPLAGFLRAHAPALAAEVRSCYVEAAGGVLARHLRAYAAALDRACPPDGGRAPLVGAPRVGSVGASGAAFVSGLLRAAGAPSSALPADADTLYPRTSSFELGARGAILHHLDRPATVPRPEGGGGRGGDANAALTPEEAFRSLNKLLCDAATSEYVFCASFFGSDGAFHDTFAAPLAAAEGAATARLAETSDPMALLLIARVADGHALAMARARLPALDAYHDRVTLAVWPRVAASVDAQIDSLARVGARGAGAPPREPLGPDGVAPVARRVGALSASLLTLAAGLPEPRLDIPLARLRRAAEAALARVAAAEGDREAAAAAAAANVHAVLKAHVDAAAAARAAPLPVASPTAPAPSDAPPVGPLGTAGDAALAGWKAEWDAAVDAVAAPALAKHLGAAARVVASVHAARRAASPPSLPPEVAAAALQALSHPAWASSLDAARADVRAALRRSPRAAAAAAAAVGAAVADAYRAAWSVAPPDAREGAPDPDTVAREAAREA